MTKLNKKLFRTFNKKIILVTGGTGSIGSEIVRQILPYRPKQVRVYSRDESKHFFLEQELKKLSSPVDIKYFIGDIRDKDRLEKAFQGVNIVFHAAALKHVPYCENNSFEAIKTNVYGTQNIIDLAIKNNVDRLIAISTDKAVYPNNVMGITKLLMEKMVICSKYYSGSALTKFSVVRFGNVMNSRGSVIPVWINQINEGGPVTVTDKRMKRFFMSIPDAVNLVFLAATLMKGQEIFVLKMDEENIYQLAKKTIIKNSNSKKIKIKIVGKRNGEKITEKLFTDEEKELLIECKKFYIVLPDEIKVKKFLKYYQTMEQMLYK